MTKNKVPTQHEKKFIGENEYSQLDEKEKGNYLSVGDFTNANDEELGKIELLTTKFLTDVKKILKSELELESKDFFVEKTFLICNIVGLFRPNEYMAEKFGDLTFGKTKELYERLKQMEKEKTDQYIG